MEPSLMDSLSLCERSDTDITNLNSDYERAHSLEQLLVSHATGGCASDQHYQALRRYFLSNPQTRHLVPVWMQDNHDLMQFWSFIKGKSPSYEGRRQFIWSEFGPLLSQLEGASSNTLKSDVEAELVALRSDYLLDMWRKALERTSADPDGAITAAKSLLEGLLKHILDELDVAYDKAAELHDLYRSVANILKLTPEQHGEVSIKKVLGGCSSIVSGIGELRNAVGDAHGQGRTPYRATPRHAALAVNAAGTMCLFIAQTYQWRRSQA